MSFRIYDEYEGERCKVCNFINTPEVGFQLYCKGCGEALGQPTSTSTPHPDEDVLLDERYILFDPIKAFRLLRDMDMLDAVT